MMISEKAFERFKLIGDLEKEKLCQVLKNKHLKKGEHLLNAGEICRAVYFLNRGAIYQYDEKDYQEIIIDLHIAGEWFLNQVSFVTQATSQFGIKAFEESEVYELSVFDLHKLIEGSSVFLSFGQILEQGKERKMFFDTSLTPSQKYEFIIKNKPALLQIFPLKMIASYLKVSPETLSRVRGKP